MNQILPHENEGIPLYRLVKAKLKEFISARHLKPGDPIPPEQKLCAELNVSRGTVRVAISDLVREGVLQRYQGRGTFVASPKFERSLLHYFRFVERDSSEAIVPESRIVKARVVLPPKNVADALGISAKQGAIELRRVRSIKGVPCIYQISFFPEKLFPGLHEIDPDIPSLYDYIRDRYRTHVMQVEEYLTAGLPDPQAQKLLGLDKFYPVIIIERKTLTSREVPMEFRRSIGRADRYCYRVRL
jgi:GntR family transcriptional regulator